MTWIQFQLNLSFVENALGAIVKWLELSLVKQEDLGSIPVQDQMVFLLGHSKINGCRHNKLRDLAYPCRLKKSFLAALSSDKLV